MSLCNHCYFTENAQICKGSVFSQLPIFFPPSGFFLRYQVPYSVTGTGPIFLMSHQPNLAQFHSHSISSILFQNDYISHPVKSYKSPLKNKEIKINQSVNPEHIFFSSFLFFTGLEVQPRVDVYKDD